MTHKFAATKMVKKSSSRRVYKDIQTFEQIKLKYVKQKVKNGPSFKTKRVSYTYVTTK